MLFVIQKDKNLYYICYIVGIIEKDIFVYYTLCHLLLSFSIKLTNVLYLEN